MLNNEAIIQDNDKYRNFTVCMTIEENIEDIYRNLATIEDTAPDNFRNFTAIQNIIEENYKNLATLEDIIQENCRNTRVPVPDYMNTTGPVCCHYWKASLGKI